MSNAGCEFDKVEFSNNPAPVIKPPAVIAFDRPNCTMVSESSIITGLTTHSAPAKFESDHQRPIMSHKALIMSPNYVPKFERNGNYVSRSTTSHKPSTDRRTSGKQVPSVKLTDKKSVCGQHQHCNCSTKPFSSCINKTAERQVPFPRSNSIRMINAQLPRAVRKLDFYKENTAKEFQKVHNSTDQILHQNRIEMNQSTASVSSQSATPPVSLSQPRIHAIADQSAAAGAGPDRYNSSSSKQFDITAISEIGGDTPAVKTLSDSTSNYNTTALFRATLQHQPLRTVRHRRCQGRSRPPDGSERSDIQGRPALTCVVPAVTKPASQPTTVVICWRTTLCIPTGLKQWRRRSHKPGAGTPPAVIDARLPVRPLGAQVRLLSLRVRLLDDRVRPV